MTTPYFASREGRETSGEALAMYDKPIFFFFCALVESFLSSRIFFFIENLEEGRCAYACGYVRNVGGASDSRHINVCVTVGHTLEDVDLDE